MTEEREVLVTLPRENDMLRRLLRRCGSGDGTHRLYGKLRGDAGRKEMDPEGVVNIVVAAIEEVIADMRPTPHAVESAEITSKLDAMRTLLNVQFEAILSALLDGSAYDLAVAHYKRLLSARPR